MSEEEEKKKVEAAAAFEEEEKKNAEAFAEEQLALARHLAEKGTKENAIGFITINDFLNFHLTLDDEELCSILNTKLKPI